MQHDEDTVRRGQKVANWVLDHRLITILFVLVPSLILAYALPSIEVYSRFADLLPAKHTYIKNYNRMKQTFGGANVVTMSLEVVGEVATRWMSIAQCFAGGPVDPPKPGERTA